MDVRGMRTLIYKRTHSGDPDPASGVFGNADCMKSVRGRSFDAVIGIGGIGPEPIRNRIAGKLTWVGIGPHKTGDPCRPQVTFDHFLYYGEDGRLFETLAPTLARHIYSRNVRTIMDSLSGKERAETERILRMALKAPASAALLRRADDASTKRRVRDADECGVRKPASGASVTEANRSTKC
jgi:hypothetical protein